MSSAPQPFYLAGEWRSAKATEKDSVSQIRNPFDDSLVGSVFLASASDAEEAVRRTNEGFQKTRALPSFQRAEILSRISSLIKEQREEFAQLICAEVGKPIQYARVEVDRAVTTFQLAAEEAKRIGGEVVPLDLAAYSRGRFGVVRRFPVGVILAIVPFNFPLNLAAHKVAPAIASGNSFILKPPPQAPLTGLKLAKVIDDAGFPPQGFAVIPCRNDVAERLVRHEQIKMVSFTGSPAVGWSLKEKAGKKKVTLELGGNAGVIVDSTANVEAAAKKNVVGSFAFSGQICIKVQRIYVQEEIYENYVGKLIEISRGVKTGDPRDVATVVGPVVNDAAADRIDSWIKEAVKEGATLLVGGRRERRMVEPTVIVDVSRESRVFRNEIFGPVATLHKFKSIEEAVTGVNDSTFGLQAGMFSNDLKNILYAYEHLDVGALIVNDNPTYRVDNMPYGGIKDSGFGREGLKYAIEAMTEPKMLAVG